MPDRHGLGLLDEAHLAEVGLARHGHAHRRGGVERRGVDGRHELGREEGAHGLADHVGADHARDAEPVRELGGQGALADAGGAADEHDERRLQPAQRLPLAEPRDEHVALLAAELVASDLAAGRRG